MSSRAIGAAAAVALALAACDARAFAGVVTRISDGDTVWVQPADGERAPFKLRLRGIDAPELCQAWGPQARDALAARVLQRRVEVDVRSRDSYGRALASLRLRGVDVAAWLVADGHAWSTRWRGRAPYLQEEQAARAARRGLHADAHALEPRRFRRLHGPCS